MDIGGKRMGFKSSIRSRIIINFGAIVIATVVVLEVLFVAFVQNYYYGGVEQILKDRVNISAEFLNRYFTYSSVEEKAKFLFENNISSYDNKFLVQILNKEKIVVMDSNGLSEFSVLETDDINDAFNNKITIYESYSEMTGERMLSASRPLLKYNQIDGVIRYTVSMEKVDREVKNYILGGLALGATVIIFFMLLALIISKSIVNPIMKLNVVAKSMAEGNFDQKANKIYDDEIGQLTETMNYMAEEILKTDKIKKDFISSISHELRTPLTSIKGWSETLMMEESVSQNEALGMGLGIISGEADRLKDMVEELLDFSRLESSRMKVVKRKINPKHVLEQVYRQLQPRAAHITLSCNKIGKDTMIMGDENRLRQVFINLLANAIKFTPAGGSVQIEAEGQDEQIIIRFIDTGLGISKEDLPNVTQKFYKGNQTMAGSGLGLSIVDEILKLHDAKFYIDSKLGEGTTVTVIIPAVTE